MAHHAPTFEIVKLKFCDANPELYLIKMEHVLQMRSLKQLGEKFKGWECGLDVIFVLGCSQEPRVEPTWGKEKFKGIKYSSPV